MRSCAQVGTITTGAGWLPSPPWQAVLERLKAADRRWRRLLVSLRHGGDDAPPNAPVRSSFPQLDADPDADLLRLILEGVHDTRAFERLMSRYWSAAWSICQSVLLNEDDAEDATQDVFLKVHRYLPGFRFESRFSTWLRRIARNTALNHLASRRREIESRARAERDPTIAKVWSPWRPSRPGIGRLQVRAALRRLDPMDRMILVMHEIEGVPYEEIGEALDLAAGAVRMRALRARERLRALLARGSRAGGQGGP